MQVIHAYKIIYYYVVAHQIQKQQECFNVLLDETIQGQSWRRFTFIKSNSFLSYVFFFTKDQLNVLTLNIIKHTDKKEHFIIQCTDKKGSIQCNNVKNINLFLFHSHSICH